MIPKISVTLQNGALGSVATSEDGVAGLVIGCNPGTSGIIAGDIFVLRSVDDAKANNIDQIPFAYQHIVEFYNEAGNGAKLYVMIVANTESLTNIADGASTNKYAKKLLDYAGGEIKILGICRMPAAGYTMTLPDGIDGDVLTAKTKLQALAVSYHAAFKPFVGIIAGYGYQGETPPLVDLTEGSDNFVGICISASSEMNAIDGDASSVGLVLGRAASVPVQRKVARVKDGSLSITGAYNGELTVESSDVESISNKGYIVIGTFANKSGYYFMDDTLATDQTEDYKTICNRRVMNKMVRIVYSTYINELNDDIELTSEGKLSPATAKYYEGLIENQVNNQMTANGELSSFSAFVDMNQNVLSTGKIVVKCSAVPKGYSQEISVILGFSNPVLSV